MECKSEDITFSNVAFLIRIEPDWNVNLTLTVGSGRILTIRIEPDWNVNDKWRDRPKNQYLIRIEPDWNVNLFANK